MNFYNVLLVGAGGFAGSIARYITVQSVEKRLNAVFPYGTLAVNIIGSFLLGLIVGMLFKKSGAVAYQWKLLLGTGFCGGFTTFSAFALENFNLIGQKFMGTALLYIVASVAFGLAAVWAGLLLGKIIS